MKTHTEKEKQLLGLFILLFVFSAIGQTNRFFVTDEMPLHQFDPDPFTPEAVERAKHAPESRPAAEDPEGNWGTPSEGFQLSIRFDKVVFTNGEPINAWTILRNVSDKTLKHDVLKLERTPESRFIITHALTGTNLLARPRGLRQGSFGSRASRAGSQRRFLMNVAQEFEALQPGKYTVQAVLRIPKLDGTGRADITSGKASFRIVEGVKSASPSVPKKS